MRAVARVILGGQRGDTACVSMQAVVTSALAIALACPTAREARVRGCAALPDRGFEAQVTRCVPAMAGQLSGYQTPHEHLACSNIKQAPCLLGQ